MSQQPHEEPPPTYDTNYYGKQQEEVTKHQPPSPVPQQGGTTVVHVQQPSPAGPPPQAAYGYGQPPPQGQPQSYGQAYAPGPAAAGPIVITNGMLSHEPQTMTCPHCRQTVVTRTSYQVGLTTWAIAGGLCLFGCWLGCCFIPFCVNQAKDCRHDCPACGKTIGTHKHLN